MNVKNIVIVLACIALIAAQASDVVETKDSNFDEVIKSHDFVLMKFYAPWCGHCKKLAPEWEKASTALKGSAVLGKLDATAETATAGKFDIKGYPTIKVFRGGELQGDYEGGRTAEAIVKYVKSNAGPALNKVDSAADLEKFKKENSAIVVLFAKDTTGAAFQTFEEVAKSMRATATFVAVSDSSLFDGGDNSVVIYKQFDEPREVFSGELTAEALSSFVKNGTLKLFDEIGPENYKNYIELRLPIVWVFATPGNADSEAAKSDAAEVAKDFKGKLSFVWIDASKYGGMAQRLGLKGDKFPSLAIDFEGQHYAFDEADTLTQEKMKNFANDYLSGGLQQTIRSEAAPEQHTVEGLTTVVGSTFDELITNTDKDVLIEFYAPWCGHCKKLAPTYKKVAEATSHVEHLRIAQIDATNNDFNQKLFPVQGFPTIFFKPKGSTEPKAYEGERSFKGFIDFLKAASSATFEVTMTDDEL